MRRKKFYGKSVVELLTKAQEALNKDVQEKMMQDCLTEKARDKLKGMMKYEPSPLDIDTQEQQYLAKDYTNFIKVKAKDVKDEEKAKKIQELMEWYMKTNGDKVKHAFVEEMLYGFGIDPTEYLKPSINIPKDEIRKALGRERGIS